MIKEKKNNLEKIYLYSNKYDKKKRLYWKEKIEKDKVKEIIEII